VNFTIEKRIPSMPDRAYPETADALMSFGADEEELWRLAAARADKILKGCEARRPPYGTAGEV
jgi:ABC-type uncharacterized transport system substrate-binding protein